MLGSADYTRFSVSLFTVLTPFAAIPLFLTLTSDYTPPERTRTAMIATGTVFSVLVASALAGDTILDVIGTSLGAFRVGGGVVLLLMALSMLNAKLSQVQHTQEERGEAEAKDEVGVVPLGLPLLAGPGSISTVIIEMGRSTGVIDKAAILGCITLVCGILLGSLLLAVPIGRALGKTGLNILNRLFGLLLAAIAIQLAAGGLKELFPILAR
jgi:multiple antibiotic resistance protein